MTLAESAVRMYLFYIVGTIGLLALATVLGTVFRGPSALFVGFLVLLAVVLGGLFWYARF